MSTKKSLKLFVVSCVVLSNALITNLFVNALTVKSADFKLSNDNKQIEQLLLESKLIGDVNGDDSVDSMDFAYMRKHLLNSNQSFPISNDLWASDTNGDGEFNSIDFACMRQFLLGRIKDFPAEDLMITEPNCFDYALVSGNGEKELIFFGDKFEIYGDIHSNSEIEVFAGPDAIIYGNVSSVEKVNISGLSTEVTNKDYAQEILIPNLSYKFIKESILSGTYISDTYSNLTNKMYYQDLIDGDGKLKNNDLFENCILNYSEDSNPKWIISGEKLVLHEDTPIFFDGDVKLSIDQITGSGFVVATGNIIIDSNENTDFGLKYLDNGEVDLLNSSEIGLYSINGDVQFAKPTKLKGLIYTPEKSFDGKFEIEIYGSIVADYLDNIGMSNKIFYTKTSLHKMFCKE